MKTKARHLQRLARSKSYILITDDDAVINIKDVNPTSIQDSVVISAQLAYLKRYEERLRGVIRVFERHIAKDFETPIKLKKTRKNISVK